LLWLVILFLIVILLLLLLGGRATPAAGRKSRSRITIRKRIWITSKSKSRKRAC
jgi:hypothetical protein